MPACPACGQENKPDDMFCVHCGKTLADAAGTGLPGLIDAGIVCPKCDTYNEPDLKTCMRCGASLRGMTGYLDAVRTQPRIAAAEDEEDTLVERRPTAEPQPLPVPPPAPPSAPPGDTQPEMPAARAPSTPARPGQSPGASDPSAKKPTGQMPAAVAVGVLQPQRDEVCPFCQAKLLEGAGFCMACGQKLRPSAPSLEAASDLSIRLRLVRGYGREDSTFPVGPAGVTVGKERALINIANDPFLSPLHTAFRMQGSKLLVEDLNSHNGTFLRVRSRVDLRQGIEFIVGSQRMLLLGLGGPTTDVRTPSSRDTRSYGGPLPRQLFVAVRLLHTDTEGHALGGAIILRSGPVVTIGQKGCDINFPDDSRMAPRHVELHIRASGLQAVETGASSGVYLRIPAPAVLQNGDEVMAGEEVFRVEMG